MINAFSFAASQPWAIEPEAYRTVLEVAARLGDPEALATRRGRTMEGTRRVEIRGDVAVIPVHGPVFRYANLLTDISGATSTGVLATDFQAALDNPAVRRIVLDIDSPGGEMHGIHELADQIYSARARKRIDAYVGGVGASAGYWIASAADRIVVSPTALVGSIGVVMTHLDTRQRDAKAGVEKIDIVSSGSPFKRDDVRTDEGRARVQVLVDQLCDVFVTSVARNRNTQSRKVLDNFGRGGLIVGAAAVRAGMAESLGSLEDVIADRSTRSQSSPRASAADDPPSFHVEGPGSGPRCASFTEIAARRRGDVTGDPAAADTEGLSFSASIFAKRRAGTAQGQVSSQGAQPQGVATSGAPATAAPSGDSGNSLSPSTIFARRAEAVAAAAAGDSPAMADSSSGADGLPSAESLFERRKRDTERTG